MSLNNNTAHPYTQLLLEIRNFLIPQATLSGTPVEDISANPNANIGLVNTVTTGDIFEIDLDKMTLFPLAHIVVNNVSVNNHHYVFNISVLFMDVVDIVKNKTHKDSFMGNTNEQEYEGDLFHEAMKNMPLSVAMGSMLFFYRLEKDLLQTLAGYSTEGLPKAHLEENGVGMQAYMLSHKETLPDSTK